MILSNELALCALNRQRTFRVKYFLQNINNLLAFGYQSNPNVIKQFYYINRSRLMKNRILFFCTKSMQNGYMCDSRVFAYELVPN